MMESEHGYNGHARETAFQDLLVSVQWQHDVDVSAAAKEAQEENRKLSHVVACLEKEVVQLRAAMLQPLIKLRNAGDAGTSPRKPPPLPNVPAVLADESFENRHSGMTECDQTLRHRTSLVNSGCSNAPRTREAESHVLVDRSKCFTDMRNHEADLVLLSDSNGSSMGALHEKSEVRSSAISSKCSAAVLDDVRDLPTPCVNNGCSFAVRDRNSEYQMYSAPSSPTARDSVLVSMQFATWRRTMGRACSSNLEPSRHSEIRRVKRLLGVAGKSCNAQGHVVFTAEELHKVLRSNKKNLTLEDVRSAMQAFECVARDHLSYGEQSVMYLETLGKAVMDVEMFVDVIMLSELTSLVDAQHVAVIAEIQESVQNERFINRVIEAATFGPWGYKPRAMTASDLDSRQHAQRMSQISNLLQALVSIAVVLNLVVMGFSLDNDPEGVQWIIVDGLFCVIFVAEVTFKLVVYGLVAYFRGPDWMLNWLDFILTTMSVADVVFCAVMKSTRARQNQTPKRILVALRIIRISRAIRLVKLMQVPYLRELTDMVTGLRIGVPWLVWVIVLLIVCVYLVGVIFRVVVGPGDDPPLTPECGQSADLLAAAGNSTCPLHTLYGEEFFGTVTMSMFTVFRCMIGDCTTKSGQSLPVHFSQGYGVKFDICYAASMVIVIFGLFNTITAVFVEATMSGLKYNESKRRYQHVYELKYTETKLAEMARLMYDIFGLPVGVHMVFTPENFGTVMRHPDMNQLLDDLDFPEFNRPGLFDIFDVNGDGEISVTEFLTTVQRLRGEMNKADVVAIWILLCTVRDSLEDLKKQFVKELE